MTKWQDRFKVVPAAYVVFRRGDEVLLLQRANTGYFDGSYSLPAGHLDGKESARLAACREAAEEVGVSVRPADLAMLHVMHRLGIDHERVDFYFEARAWQGDIKNMEPHKCSDLRWATLKQAQKLQLTPEVAQALRCIGEGAVYSEFGFSGHTEQDNSDRAEG